MSNDKFKCPHCGSDNTRNVEVIYREGHSTGTARSREITGFTAVKTSVRIDYGGEKHVSQSGGDAIYEDVERPVVTTSDLARTIAPPPHPNLELEKMPSIWQSIGIFLFTVPVYYIGAVIILFYFLPSVWNFLPTSAIIIFCILFSLFTASFERIINTRTNKERQQKYDAEMPAYRKAYDHWRHHYLCLRCGHKFYVDDEGTISQEMQESLPSHERTILDILDEHNLPPSLAESKVATNLIRFCDSLAKK